MDLTKNTKWALSLNKLPHHRARFVGSCKVDNKPSSFVKSLGVPWLMKRIKTILNASEKEF